MGDDLKGPESQRIRLPGPRGKVLSQALCRRRTECICHFWVFVCRAQLQSRCVRFGGESGSLGEGMVGIVLSRTHGVKLLPSLLVPPKGRGRGFQELLHCSSQTCLTYHFPLGGRGESLSST